MRAAGGECDRLSGFSTFVQAGPTRRRARCRARRAPRSGRRRRAARRACRARRSCPWSSTTIWSASRTVERRWAMTIVVRPSASRRERLLDRALRLHVERARGLVEHEHGRVAQDRPGDRDALLLPAGEAEAALADDGVVALGQRRDDVVDLGGAGGLLDLRVGGVRPREAQVLAHRRVEEVGLLRDDADRGGERLEASGRARRRRRSARRRARRRRGARRGSRAWSCPSRSRRRSRSASRPGSRGRCPPASSASSP